MRAVGVKSVREEPADADGFRILVNRLWPRGMSKTKAAVDEWCKEIAPSTALRRAFHSDEIDYTVFRARYFDEIESNPDTSAAFRELVVAHLPVTLVYDSKRSPNHADVLCDWLDL